MIKRVNVSFAGEGSQCIACGGDEMVGVLDVEYTGPDDIEENDIYSVCLNCFTHCMYVLNFKYKSESEALACLVRCLRDVYTFDNVILRYVDDKLQFWRSIHTSCADIRNYLK